MSSPTKKEMDARIKNNCGIIFARTNERSEAYFVTEDRPNPKIPVYKLRVIGEYTSDRHVNRWEHEKCKEAETSLARKKGNDVEYLAFNATRFNLASPSFWNNWDGENADGAHHEIYTYMKSMLDTMRPRNALVIGCGTGALLEYFRQRNIHATGIDANPLNVIAANQKGLIVQNIKIEDFFPNEKYDLVVDPGVISSMVIDPEMGAECLDGVIAALDSRGTFIQIPFTRSLLTGPDLRACDFEVLQCTEPKNLFTYNYPKQVYVAKKR